MSQNELLALINSQIKENGKNEITGAQFNAILQNLVSVLGQWTLNNGILQTTDNGAIVKFPYLSNPRESTYTETQLVVDNQGIIKRIAIRNEFAYIGEVVDSSSFPTPNDVKAGDTYTVIADVVDNNPIKTNTGQSIPAGSKIYWDKTMWADFSKLVFELSEDIDGITITKNNISKGLFGIKIYIEENELLTIPENFEYNCTELEIEGDIELDGEINYL